MILQKTKKTFSLILLIMIILALGIYLFRESEFGDIEKGETTSAIDSQRHFDMELFLKGEVGKNKFEIPDNVKGLIIPHHLLASSLISSAFTALPNRFDNVIVLGPNHFEKGDKLAYTTDKDFRTAFSLVTTDRKKYNSLFRDTEMISLDDKIISGDHSVNVPINYLAKYLPDTKVFALLLNETEKIEDIEVLADIIAPYLDDNTLIVSSIDMSHYLTDTEARIKDRETINALVSHDHGKLLGFGPGNLDSSTSIILLDMLMQRSNAQKIEILSNINSYDLTGHNREVTSYIVAVYH